MKKSKHVEVLHHQKLGEVSISFARISESGSRIFVTRVGHEERILSADAKFWLEDPATVEQLWQRLSSNAPKISSESERDNGPAIIDRHSPEIEEEFDKMEEAA